MGASTNTHSQNIKEGIDGHAASWYSDVFDLVFPNIDAKHANNIWKAQLKKPDHWTPQLMKHDKQAEELEAD